jgi:hypothetical protein
VGSVAEAAEALEVLSAVGLGSEHDLSGTGHVRELVRPQRRQESCQAAVACVQELGDQRLARRGEEEGSAAAVAGTALDPVLVLEYRH